MASKTPMKGGPSSRAAPAAASAARPGAAAGRSVSASAAKRPREIGASAGNVLGQSTAQQRSHGGAAPTAKALAFAAPPQPPPAAAPAASSRPLSAGSTSAPAPTAPLANPANPATSMVIAVRIKPAEAGQKDGFEEGRGAITRDGAHGKVMIEMTTELGTASSDGGGADGGGGPSSGVGASSSTSSGRSSTKAFAPEHVFLPSDGQAEVYAACARDVVLGVAAGINGAIIAYGQTGSGKTHTMLGDPSSDTQQGIIPRATTDLFARLEAVRAAELARPDVTAVASEIRASYVEIYQEQPYDLLAGSAGGSSFAATAGPRGGGAFGSGGGGFLGAGDEPRKLLRIREDVGDDGGGFFLEDLTRVTLTSPHQALEVLAAGFSLRRTASTAMNARSSRSHAVLSLQVDVCITSRDSEGVSHATTRSGLLDIVDLAGSERQRDTGAEGSTVKEAGKINNSLGCLADVVKTTVDNQMARNSKMIKPVPWRNSRLTMLLKRSLSGNSKTVFVFCISPALDYWAESNNTLLFADRARRLKTEPSSNERTVLMGGTQVQVAQMAKEIAALKAQLVRARVAAGTGASLGQDAAAAALAPALGALSLSAPGAAAAGCDLGASLGAASALTFGSWGPAGPLVGAETGQPDVARRVDFGVAPVSVPGGGAFSPLVERQLRGLGALARVLQAVESCGAATASTLMAAPDTSSAALAQIEARVRSIEEEGAHNGVAHVAAQLTARLAMLEAQLVAASEERRLAADGCDGSDNAAKRVCADRNRHSIAASGGATPFDGDGGGGLGDYGRLSCGSALSEEALGSPEATKPTSASSAALRAVEARLGQWRQTAAAELAAPMTEVLHEAARKDAALAEYRAAVAGMAAKSAAVEASLGGLREALATLDLSGTQAQAASAAAASLSGAPCVGGVGALSAASGLIQVLNEERRRLQGHSSAVEARLLVANGEVAALRAQLAEREPAETGDESPAMAAAVPAPIAVIAPRAPRLVFGAGAVARQLAAPAPAATAASAVAPCAALPVAVMSEGRVESPSEPDCAAFVRPCGEGVIEATAATVVDIDSAAALAPVAADLEPAQLRLTAATLVAGTVAMDAAARGGAASFLRPFARGASESMRQDKPRVSSANPSEVVAALARVRQRNTSMASAGGAAFVSAAECEGAPAARASLGSGSERDSPDAETCAFEACMPASARASMISVAESTSSVGTSISGRMEAAERRVVGELAAAEAAAAAEAVAAAEAAAAQAEAEVVAAEAAAKVKAAAAPVPAKRPLASLIARAVLK